MFLFICWSALFSHDAADSYELSDCFKVADAPLLALLAVHNKQVLNEQEFNKSILVESLQLCTYSINTSFN